MIALLYFTASAFLVWLLCFPLPKELLHRQLIDRPNERSNHVVPTPRGGGIAILAVVIIGFAVIGLFNSHIIPFVLAAGALLISIISLLDDVKPLSARVRFATHSIAALSVLTALAGIRSMGGFLPTPLRLLFGVALFLGIVGYTNAFNFMDGINGIAAGQAFITGLGTALILGFATGNWFHPLLLCSLVLAGASFGFLPHNFPRARMFMGDVGSAPLGFLLAALAVTIGSESGWYLLVPLLLLHLNYIGDTSITLVRRFLRGERLYEAHKEHFYQRLVRAGKSHSFATGLEMALQCLTLALSLVYVNTVALPFRVALVLLVVFTWSLFFVYAEISFQRTTQRRSESIATLSASAGERAG